MKPLGRHPLLQGINHKVVHGFMCTDGHRNDWMRGAVRGALDEVDCVHFHNWHGGPLALAPCAAEHAALFSPPAHILRAFPELYIPPAELRSMMLTHLLTGMDPAVKGMGPILLITHDPCRMAGIMEEMQGDEIDFSDIALDAARWIEERLTQILGARQIVITAHFVESEERMIAYY